ncbi:MAG: CHASE3 domain-containing protein [Candidatus Acidiferrales bacterium]
MKSSLERKVAIGFAVTLIGVAGLFVLQYRAERRLTQDSQWVSHSHDVLRELESTRNSLNRADASAQSMVITGDTSYIATYGRAIAGFNGHARNLRELTVDNDKQQSSLNSLESSSLNAIRALQEEMNSRKTAPLAAAQALSLESSVRVSLDDVRSVISNMETEEWELLRQRNDAAEWANHRVHEVILLGSLLVIVFIGLFAAALLVDVAERERAEERLRALSGRLLQIQEDERRHIGRELHDSLGQYLSALKMRLESLRPEIEPTGDGPAEDLVECINLAEQSLSEVRTASYLLYPALLDEMGLQLAIPMYLEGFSKRCGVQTTFESPTEIGRADRDVELALFRVLQESLTNVHRHSGSATAHIRIAREDGFIRLEVTDAGKGMPKERLDEFHKYLPDKMGVGLRGMHERMRQFGGKLEVSSGSRGTTVRVTMPVA